MKTIGADQIHRGDLLEGQATIDVAISESGTLSAPADLGGRRIVGVILPAGFTGTTLGFKASPTLAGTYRTVYGSTGSALAYTVAADRWVVLPYADLFGLGFVELVVAAQASATTVTLVVQ